MITLPRLLILLSLFICNIAFSQGDENIMAQKFSQTLYNQLPLSIQESKQIIAVNNGHVPPYVIYNEAGNISGLSIDLFNAVSQILGVKIQHNQVVGVPAILLGVQSGKYDLAIGPITDLPERQLKNDFIPYAISYIAIAVQKGNPHNIHSSADMCGRRMAAVSGNLGVELLASYSENCVKEGKKPINVMVFKDQPTAVLSVKSDRTDGMLGGVAILSYYINKNKNELELAGVKEGERYYSAMLSKDSPLSPVILAAIEELFDNGTYAEIMKKWNMEVAMLPATGINLAK